MNSDFTKEDIRVPHAKIAINSWQELLTIMGMFSGNWIFRGVSEESHGIKSSIERDIPQAPYDKKNFRKLPSEHHAIVELERALIYNFQRRSQHFFEENEQGIQFTETLSLMQHNGISTRLVDWTKSPYDAAYFAMRRVGKKGPAVIWAVNLDDFFNYAKLLIYNLCQEEKKGLKIDNNIDRESKESDRKHFLKLINTDINIIRNNQSNRRLRVSGVGDISNIIFDNVHFFKEKKPGVVPLIPKKLNKRIMAQQAMFLCPMDIRFPFVDNLGQVYLTLSENKIPFSLAVKIEIPQCSENQDKIFEYSIKELNRFNINGYTLLPDKTGLSSWFSEFFIPHKIETKSNDGSRLTRFLNTQIHFIIRIPNQPGAIANALKVFRKWHVNIDHFTLASEDHAISRWTIDGSVDWKNLYKYLVHPTKAYLDS